MNIVRSFKRRWWRIEVWCTLAWSVFLINHVPFARWRTLLGPFEEEADRQEGDEFSSVELQQARAIGRFVESVADRAIFRPVCLPRAMAGRWVLQRRGIRSRIIVGSRRGEADQRLLFHAWLIVGGKIVIGAKEREHFLEFRKSEANGTASANRLRSQVSCRKEGMN